MEISVGVSWGPTGRKCAMVRSIMATFRGAEIRPYLGMGLLFLLSRAVGEQEIVQKRSWITSTDMMNIDLVNTPSMFSNDRRTLVETE